MFRGVGILFHRLEMHPGKGADDFKVTELLRADVHEQVLAGHVVAVNPLDRILHGGSQLAVGAAELFEKHIAKTRIGLTDADGEHEFLNVVIHSFKFGDLESMPTSRRLR